MKQQKRDWRENTGEAIYLDELEQFRQVRPGYANDLDKFADLLDIPIINLKEVDIITSLAMALFIRNCSESYQKAC